MVYRELCSNIVFNGETFISDTEEFSIIKAWRIIEEKNSALTECYFLYGDEASGKTTCIEILEAYLLAQDKPYFSYKLRLLNTGESIRDVYDKINDCPKNCTIIFDGYDELTSQKKEKLVELIKFIKLKNISRVIVSARYKPREINISQMSNEKKQRENIAYNESFEVVEFKDYYDIYLEPLEVTRAISFLNKYTNGYNVNFGNISEEIFNRPCDVILLANRIQKKGIRIDEYISESSLLEEHLDFLCNKYKEDSIYDINTLSNEIGKRYFDYKLKRKNNKKLVLPSAIRTIFWTYIDTEGNEYIDYKHVKFMSLCLGRYIATHLLQQEYPSKKALEIILNIELEPALMESFIFAGQYLVSQKLEHNYERVWKCLDAFPKKSTLVYKNILFLYLGANNFEITDTFPNFNIGKSFLRTAKKLHFFLDNPFIKTINSNNIDSLLMIPSNELNSCGLRNLIISAKIIRSFAFAECNNFVDIQISNGVKIIKSFAFAGCHNLECVSIGSSIKNVNSYAFFDCPNLSYIDVDAKNKYLKSSGNCLIHKKTLTLLLGCKNSIIPNDGSVVKIKNGAFNGDNLGCDIIEVPNCVKKIYTVSSMMLEINSKGKLCKNRWKRYFNNIIRPAIKLFKLLGSFYKDLFTGDFSSADVMDEPYMIEGTGCDIVIYKTKRFIVRNYLSDYLKALLYGSMFGDIPELDRHEAIRLYNKYDNRLKNIVSNQDIKSPESINLKSRKRFATCMYKVFAGDSWDDTSKRYAPNSQKPKAIVTLALMGLFTIATILIWCLTPIVSNLFDFFSMKVGVLTAIIIMSYLIGWFATLIPLLFSRLIIRTCYQKLCDKFMRLTEDKNNIFDEFQTNYFVFHL